MRYEIKFTTAQGGFYYPRCRFETEGDAREWAETQLKGSPRLASYEVRLSEAYINEMLKAEAGSKNYISTSLFISALIVVFICLLIVFLGV